MFGTCEKFSSVKSEPSMPSVMHALPSWHRAFKITRAKSLFVYCHKAVRGIQEPEPFET